MQKLLFQLEKLNTAIASQFKCIDSRVHSVLMQLSFQGDIYNIIAALFCMLLPSTLGGLVYIVLHIAGYVHSHDLASLTIISVY